MCGERERNVVLLDRSNNTHHRIGLDGLVRFDGPLGYQLLNGSPLVVGQRA